MIKYKIEFKCLKHPKYNPLKDGQNGIKGGCTQCSMIFEAYWRIRKIEEDLKRNLNKDELLPKNK